MQEQQEAGKKKAHLAWMCALIAVTALGALLYYLPFMHPYDLVNAQPLLTGWSYFTASNPAPVAVDVLDYFIPFDTQDSMTLTRKMTEEVPEAHLLLRLTYARARVFVGDDLLYENLNNPPGENPGVGVQLIELPDDYLGQELKIAITSPYVMYAYSLDPIYFGDATSLAALVQAHSALAMAMLSVMVFGGVVLMCVAMLGMHINGSGRNWWADLCFGLFAVLYGLSLVAPTDLFLIVYPPVLGGNVDYLLWYLFPIPLALYLWMKSTGFRRLAQALLILVLLNSITALLGALLGLWALPASILVTNYAYTGLVILAGVLVVLESIKGNPQFRFFAPGLLLLIVSALLGTVAPGRFYLLKEGMRVAGLLLLMALVLVDGLRSLVHARRQRDSERQLLRIKALLATEQLDTAETYNQETRLLRHEISHHLAAMAVLQREGKLKEIGVYLAGLHDQTEHRMETTRYCEHTLVNAILSKTAGECKRGGIAFTCDAYVPPEISLPDGDLSTLLLNMFENAVEAARKAPEGSRWVAAQVRVKDEFLVVSCRNARCKGKLEHHDGRFLSTKENAGFHGFGILAMRQVAERHNSKLNIQYDEESFSVKTVLQLESPQR